MFKTSMQFGIKCGVADLI